MTGYLIFVLIDGEFASNPIPEGMFAIATNKGYVNSNIFQHTDLFKPIQNFLNLNKKIKDITKKELYKLYSPILNIENIDEVHENRFTLNVDLDNEYDLSYIMKDRDRLLFNYINSPVRNLYCMDTDDNRIEISLTPYSQSYSTLSGTEWWYFMDYLKNEQSISEKRDIKIDKLLETPEEKSCNYYNIVRQLKFIHKADRNKSINFTDSVYEYYTKNGFITNRQSDKLKEIIWRVGRS